VSRVAAIALTVVVATACPVATTRAQDAPLPNIVILQADDLHYKALGCMGDPVRTPNIDAIAARGVLFRNMVCQGTSCSPSRISLLTGSYPHNTGVYRNPDRDAADLMQRWTFPAALRRAGYHTAFVGKNHFVDPMLPSAEHTAKMQALGFVDSLSTAGKNAVATRQLPDDPYREFLIERGLLETLKTDYKENRARGDGRHHYAGTSVLSEADYIDTYITDRALERIAQLPAEQPFLMWVSFAAPHPPLDAPEPYAGMYAPSDVRAPIALPEGEDADEWRAARAAYYALMSLVDAQVGRLLGALDEAGRLDDTIVVFTADQGSMLGDHGLTGKGTFYRAAINAPLVVAGPGVRPSGPLDQPVEMLDLVPTFLGLAGVADDDRGTGFGHSLAPLLTGTGTYARRMAFCEEFKACAIVDERYKLVDDKLEPLLFDLVNDPDELHNVIAEHPAEAARLRAAINELLLETAPVRPPCSTPDAKLRQRGPKKKKKDRKRKGRPADPEDAPVNPATSR
jgi:arylsulfatase A-like enzyme